MNSWCLCPTGCHYVDLGKYYYYNYSKINKISEKNYIGSRDCYHQEIFPEIDNGSCVGSCGGLDYFNQNN